MARTPYLSSEKTLSKPSLQYASAFENAAIGMALVRPDGARLRINRAFCDLLGYSEAELRGLTLAETVHPDDLAEDRRQRQIMLAGAVDHHARDKRFLHKDGRTIWAHTIATLVRDRAGVPLHFIIQAQDISERLLAQQALRDSVQQLRETEALLHMAADIGRLGAWAHETGHATVIWSHEVCAIHEVSRGFRPTPAQALEFFAPGCRAAMAATLRACAREGTPFDVEAQAFTARGRPLWLRVIGEAEWDAQGRVRRMQGACQDITDTRRLAQLAQDAAGRMQAELEEQVARRTAQLAAANKELEAVAYSIAHDLRSPLGSIEGFSRMLEQAAPASLDDRCRHYLSRIRAGVRQMGELTDGLLALASLSRVPVRHEPVDLALLAQAAIAHCQQQSPMRTVDVGIAPTLPVMGDTRLLGQLMGHLVANAWKFTAGSAQPRIEVGMQEEAGRQVFFVRDNGVGFDMAYAGRLFEAFHRLHPAGEFDGNGIGLAIVRKIVARHGGAVWAEAALQQGACFRFVLHSNPG